MIGKDKELSRMPREPSSKSKLFQQPFKSIQLKSQKISRKYLLSAVYSTNIFANLTKISQTIICFTLICTSFKLIRTFSRSVWKQMMMRMIIRKMNRITSCIKCFKIKISNPESSRKYKSSIKLCFKLELIALNNVIMI